MKSRDTVLNQRDGRIVNLGFFGDF